MEIILKTNNESSLAKIVALAKKLNDVTIEQKDTIAANKKDLENLKDRIRNFQPQTSSSFGDAAEWQQKERSDRDLPFSK